MVVSNSQVVATRVEPEIIEKLDEVAKARGISRSDLLRMLIIKELAGLSYLPAHVKKALGVFPPENSTPIKNEKEVEENG